MIWSYRAVNNRIARRKWIALSLVLIAIGSIYTAHRISSGGNIFASLSAFTLFALMVFLYTVITLGRVRYYIVEDGAIVYRPFRTKIDEIGGYEVDRDNMVIRLKLKRPKIFAVKTLYFDKEDEFFEALRFFKRTFRLSL